MAEHDELLARLDRCATSLSSRPDYAADAAAAIRALTAQLEAERASHDTTEQRLEQTVAAKIKAERRLAEMLCIIHRDGGQYITQHGEQRAYDDACELLHQWKVLPDRLAEVQDANSELVKDLAWGKQYAMRWEKAATVATNRLAEVERETVERCAKVCEERTYYWDKFAAEGTPLPQTNKPAWLRECASIIRALASSDHFAGAGKPIEQNKDQK